MTCRGNPSGLPARPSGLPAAASRVGLVIVTYNAADFIERCLSAVAGQSRPPDRVIVIDNASRDSTVDVAREAATAASLDVEIVATASYLGEIPKVADLVGAVATMTDAYKKGEIDRVFLVYNDFVNTMSQKPRIDTLLPVEPMDKEQLQDHWDYIYEPEARDLLVHVLTRYIETQVYRAAVENVACEMASKMVAMKAATENAGKFIDALELQYNKARQAAITREIAEIVGGAAAV